MISDAPQESLLARFIELAAETLGRRPPASGPKPRSAPARSQPTPSGVSDPFPNKITFEDWSEYTEVFGVAEVAVTKASDVVDVCNKAVKNGYQVRALGHSHNWSPLIVPPGTPANPKVVLVDTSLLNTMSAAVVNGQLQATFGAGTTLLAATKFLEQQDNHGAGAAPGYSFLNMPTVGALTLGGILAVGGHGTSVPFAAQQEPGLMGCLSNMIVSFKAVTTDPTKPGSNEYAIREFQRTDADASAFLVHLGRAFITEVTLAAVPNYYLRLTNVFANMGDVMAEPSAPVPANALASLLDAHGRVEVIWFPYQDKAWVQCNARLAQKPTQPLVPGPNNYGWMNGISWEESDVLRAFFAAFPASVPDAMVVEIADAEVNMGGKTLYGTARDLEIYLTDNTLRMTAFGYVLQVPRAKVQAAVFAFYTQLQALLASYAKKQQYPVNGAVEIRCTTVDDQAGLAIAGAKPPALAATHSVNSNDATLDTVLWVDVLTFPDAPGSAQFFVDLESWTINTWGAGMPGRLRPEWSKGWAYTTAGPWTNTKLIQSWIPSVYNKATDGLTFDWAKQTLAKYDNANIFSNTFLAALFA